MNKITFTGNITKDAALRRTQDDKPVLSFTIANNQGYGDRQKAEFYDCSLWGKRAESLAPHFVKGTKLLIDGEHSTDKREHNGKEYTNNRVFVRDFEFMGGNPNATQDRAPDDSQRSAQPAGDDFEDDDIPF